MTTYDPATEGETGRRPDRRGAVRRRRRLPSRTRSRRFRRGLEQPVGARDEGPARLRLLRDATSDNGDFQTLRPRRSRHRAPARRPRPGRARRRQRGHRRGPRQVRGRGHAVEATRSSRSCRTSTSLVGGFPCQDYSVARTLRQAHGLVGKKGVLWWEIHRLLRLKLAPGRPIRLPVPRERRPPDQVADRPARARLRGDARVARRPRLRGRVASRQRRRLRVPAEAPPRLHHRPARTRRRAARTSS